MLGGGGGGEDMISQFLVLTADLILKSKEHLSCIDHHVSIVSKFHHMACIIAKRAGRIK